MSRFFGEIRQVAYLVPDIEAAMDYWARGLGVGPWYYVERLPGYRVVPVDGLAISRRHGLGRIVNSALLGALARAIEAPQLQALTRTLTAEAPKLHAENIAACADGYRSVDAQLAAVEAVAAR